MTFSVSATLDVPDSELRDLRSRVENSLTDIDVTVNNSGSVSSQLDGDTGGTSAGGVLGAGGVIGLLEDQNETLNDINQTLEKEAVTASGGGGGGGISGNLKLAASSVLSVSGVLGLSATSVLAVSGTLSLAATSVLAVAGTIDMSAGDVLATAGTLTVGISSVLAIAGTLTLGAPAVIAVTGVVGLAASAVLTVTGVIEPNASDILNVTGVFSIAAAGALAVTGTLSVPASGVIALTGTIAIGVGELIELTREQEQRPTGTRSTRMPGSQVPDRFRSTGDEISESDSMSTQEVVNQGVEQAGGENRASNRNLSQVDIQSQREIVVRDRRDLEDELNRIKEETLDEVQNIFQGGL